MTSENGDVDKANVYAQCTSISVFIYMKVILIATTFIKAASNIYILRNCYVPCSEQDKVPALNKLIHQWRNSDKKFRKE